MIKDVDIVATVEDLVGIESCRLSCAIFQLGKIF